MASLLMPLPARDSDPSEVAVTWRILRAHGHQLTFATPDGRPAEADGIMLTGQGLDPWGAIPGLRRLVLIGRIFRANRDGRDAYKALQADPAFLAPIRWQAIDPDAYDGLILPGGHRARGMRDYLESPHPAGRRRCLLRGGQACRRHLSRRVLLAARSRRADGKSVLHGRITTALTWELERAAWGIARFSRFWDPAYYRTYQEAPGQRPGHMSVQHEVTRALARNADFRDVPLRDPQRRRKTGGTLRDTLTDDRPAYVVRDGAYISARWPGDVHTFAQQFAALLAEKEQTHA